MVSVGVAGASIKFRSPLIGIVGGLTLTFVLLFLFRETHQPGIPACAAAAGFFSGVAGGVGYERGKAAAEQKRSEERSAV